jgi:prephenate dehydratase
VWSFYRNKKINFKINEGSPQKMVSLLFLNYFISKYTKMNKNKIVSIQGYPGSFHDQAARDFFHSHSIECLPADSFEILAQQLSSNKSDIAVMAIENSIAGSILQNYRILREYGFWISGEIFLKIEHCLLSNMTTKKEDIQFIMSHPMALNQCLEYLHLHFPKAKLIESQDTALSAIQLAENPQQHHACIASHAAAQLTGLKIIQKGIETNKTNYTRFFIINREKTHILSEANKASVYMKIPDEKGKLLEVLQIIYSHNLNLSKLQSFPVTGSFREYFFYLDIEFSDLNQYLTLKDELACITNEYNELGIYKRADLEIINNLVQEKIETI